MLPANKQFLIIGDGFVFKFDGSQYRLIKNIAYTLTINNIEFKTTYAELNENGEYEKYVIIWELDES